MITAKRRSISPSVQLAAARRHHQHLHRRGGERIGVPTATSPWLGIAIPDVEHGAAPRAAGAAPPAWRCRPSAVSRRNARIRIGLDARAACRSGRASPRSGTGRGPRSRSGFEQRLGCRLAEPVRRRIEVAAGAARQRQSPAGRKPCAWRRRAHVAVADQADRCGRGRLNGVPTRGLSAQLPDRLPSADQTDGEVEHRRHDVFVTPMSCSNTSHTLGNSVGTAGKVNRIEAGGQNHQAQLGMGGRPAAKSTLTRISARAKADIARSSAAR